MPVLVAAAAAAALMQYYNSQQAAGATKERLDQIQATFEKIAPPQYNVKVWDDPSLVANIPAPAWDNAKLTPEDYKSVGQFVPEVAQFVQEKQPEIVRNTASGAAGQQAQMDALAKYKEIAAAGGNDPEFAQAQQQAADRAKQDAQGRIASTLEAANRRGNLNSGTTLAAQLQGGSDAMSREAQMSQQAATDAYKNKLNAVGASAQLGGQLQNQDFSQQATNANIINSFNQRTSAAYQQYLQQKAQEQNQAAVFNNQAAQKISDANVANRNTANQRYQDMINQQAGQTWQMANQNRQNNIDVQKQKEALQTQGFNNQMAQAGGEMGIGGMQVNALQNNAANQNQAIQGAANAGTSAYMYNDYMNRAYPQQTPSNSTAAVNPVPEEDKYGGPLSSGYKYPQYNT